MTRAHKRYLEAAFAGSLELYGGYGAERRVLSVRKSAVGYLKSAGFGRKEANDCLLYLEGVSNVSLAPITEAEWG